ncbi:M16 family metallopeptidase [Streptomyces aidingensis]|uniref:Predicted Zn-dependent peptidase n=1 Tax=Streptomyces aidingensis TaxID=910347 RepID=A0A1I1IFD2_9ACTN|nr:pitrilysin family protein [Streptomyces aidingensis]SFC34875.1 Predicted Zn-dependent peptidase [Streptomyces aidingensis]
MGHTATPQEASGRLTVTEHRLANGLRVVLSEDHQTPVAAVCLWYDVGSRHEVPGRTGLAHLFEHLMFQGSYQVPGNGHFEMIQAAGGSPNGTTSFERTNYYETMPAHELELALWLEADRMGTLLTRLDLASLDNQRDVVKNERRQRYDNVPYGTAFERMVALVFPEGHPYHHTPIGSMADLDAASLEDARQFFRTYYAPDNAVLSVVGDIDPEQTLAWIERYFGSIPPYRAKPEPRDGSLPETIGEELRRVIEEAVPSRALMAAYRLPQDGTRAADAADVALTVLGGGESSRLYNRLVRRDRTAVVAGFGMLRLSGAPSLGWLDVKASGEAEIAVIERAVDEELARFAAEGPTPEEMERAQAQLEREWLDRLATVHGRADEFCRYAVQFGDPALALTAVDRVLRVTAEEVRRVAADLLHPRNRGVLVYEPTGEPPEAEAEETGGPAGPPVPDVPADPDIAPGTDAAEVGEGPEEPGRSEGGGESPTGSEVRQAAGPAVDAATAAPEEERQ